MAAEWAGNFRANVLTAVLVTEAIRPRLPDNARIVTIGSIAARGTGGSYGAAKAALEAWNAGLSRDLGPRGITANVVAPGYIEDTEFFPDAIREQRRAISIAQTRNKRVGTPADVAETVTFLASPGAGHLTGQIIHLNGGAYLGH